MKQTRYLLVFVGLLLLLLGTFLVRSLFFVGSGSGTDKPSNRSGREHSFQTKKTEKQNQKTTKKKKQDSEQDNSEHEKEPTLSTRIRAKDINTGTFVSDVRVVVRDKNGNTLWENRTDENGSVTVQLPRDSFASLQLSSEDFKTRTVEREKFLRFHKEFKKAGQQKIIYLSKEPVPVTIKCISNSGDPIDWCEIQIRRDDSKKRIKNLPELGIKEEQGGLLMGPKNSSPKSIVRKRHPLNDSLVPRMVEAIYGVNPEDNFYDVEKKGENGNYYLHSQKSQTEEDGTLSFNALPGTYTIQGHDPAYQTVKETIKIERASNNRFKFVFPLKENRGTLKVTLNGFPENKTTEGMIVLPDQKEGEDETDPRWTFFRKQKGSTSKTVQFHPETGSSTLVILPRSSDRNHIGFRPITDDVTIRSRSITEKEYVVEPEPSQLYGTVVNDSGKPIHNVSVLLVQPLPGTKTGGSSAINTPDRKTFRKLVRRGKNDLVFQKGQTIQSDITDKQGNIHLRSVYMDQLTLFFNLPDGTIRKRTIVNPRSKKDQTISFDLDFGKISIPESARKKDFKIYLSHINRDITYSISNKGYWGTNNTSKQVVPGTYYAELLVTDTSFGGSEDFEDYVITGNITMKPNGSTTIKGNKTSPKRIILDLRFPSSYRNRSIRGTVSRLENGNTIAQRTYKGVRKLKVAKQARQFVRFKVPSGRETTFVVNLEGLKKVTRQVNTSEDRFVIQLQKK